MMNFLNKNNSKQLKKSV